MLCGLRFFPANSSRQIINIQILLNYVIRVGSGQLGFLSPG